MTSILFHEVSVKDFQTVETLPSLPGIITIAGAPGSGKSTVGALLREMLPGYAFFSAGQAFRCIAEERGMTVNELTAHADQDPSIDRWVDKTLMEFGNHAKRAVIDSRMAWHFLPGSYKVYLSVGIQTAAQRIFGSSSRGRMERYTTLEDAMEAVQRRGQSERGRYRALYGVDILDMSHYDFVLDTSGMTASEAAERVMAAYLANP